MQKTAIQVCEIAFTGYPVTDMGRARQFYESVLQLVPSMVSEDGSWVEYDVNGAAFFLGKFEDWAPATSGPSVAFEVADLQEAIQVIRDAHMPVFKEPFETPGCHIAVIGDPDGNSLMLHQRKSR